ncbi:TPA: topoisomerase DNA-binding C4 zinc finger domain-containing protein [Campylobacter coli]|nr:topoisomerase DNA-binding C4 zinc finger domain-containing protein [Campylobacter coli]
MRLFIAEKPELGRAIAEGLDGNYKSGEGYIQKGDNIVTWAFGHILELAKPEEYDEKYKLWKLEDLPLPIKEFKYLPKKESKKQLKIICDLIHSDKITSIVNCGDADDEGQILVDEIIQYSKTSKPVFRVLINDLTPKAVKEEIAKIKPNADFKGMSERGFARSQADWIVGINLTRAYTIMARKNGYEGVLSVGRVQTPILSLIVNRDKEFENFKSIDYYSLLGDFNINNNTIKARLKTEDKILDENLAKEIKESCENQNAKINLKIENKKEYPPLPYNLLVLQAECAKLFGFSPDKTLEITKEVISEIQRIDKNQEFKILDNENKPKIQCPQCNKGFLTKRKGKYGNFWGCSEYMEGCKAIYPDNKGTPNFETKQASNDTTHKCPQCNKGFLQRIKSKNGNSWWWGCSEFKQGCKAMYYDNNNGKPKIINV